MRDLQHEIRDTLLRHLNDAPTIDTTEVRRAARRAHRRQVRNLVVVGIVGAAAVIVAFAGLGGLVRADQPPTIIDRPSPPTCEGSPATVDGMVRGWPDTGGNPAGVYSWDGHDRSVYVAEGFMHNGNHASGAVDILVEGHPGRLLPHLGHTTVSVAGCEATYRRFDRTGDPSGFINGPSEEWMVDIRGTTVTITLVAERASGDRSGGASLRGG